MNHPSTKLRPINRADFAIDDIFKVHPAVLRFAQVFSDAIKDHDGILKGEAYYGENGRCVFCS